MGEKYVHLCLTKSELVRPDNLWYVRWITENDSNAFSEPFMKGQEYGWTLKEFQELQNMGYSYCGVFLNGRIFSISGLWKREPDVWEVIAVGTKEEYRRKGMAKSVVYFMANHILQNVGVASYTSNESNLASINTAQSVGFNFCTNIINNDKWCANNIRPIVTDAKCHLLNQSFRK
jgi:predicted GNAT family acetyltransferase